MTDDMQQARELEPCPFCGGEAERIDFGPGDAENDGGSCIACKKCQASGPVEFGRKENFISNWNRRTAALRAAPEGFVLVPVEPTEEMVDASLISVPIAKRINPGQHLRVYGARAWAAMLAARPQGVK